jgi:dextranase
MTGYKSSFTNAAVFSTNAIITTNSVDNEQEQDLAQNGREHFYWREAYSTNTYPLIVSETAAIKNWANRAPNQIGVNWAWYINNVKSQDPTCQSNGGPNVCNFNLPGRLYAEATFFAAGAYHSWLMDGDRFNSNSYPITNQLTTTPAIIQAEYDYQTFGVAYEKLLRSDISDAGVAAPSITSGATGGTTGAPGQVFMVNKKRCGFTMLHLLNYQQLTSNLAKDDTANYPAPTPVGPLTIKMYYTAGTLGNLYLASPDINHGLAQQLTYTTGSDGGGNYITFTVPALTYWDMIWRVSTAFSDYHIP